MAIPDSLRTAAFLNTRIPIAIVDRRGLLAVWNTAFGSFFRELSGIEPELLSASLFEFIAEHEGVRFDFYAAQILLGGAGDASVETPIRASDGSRRWLRFALSLLEAEVPSSSIHTELERFLLCAVEDVTERVLREKRLMDAKEEAEKATHTKSQFLANMSHEIRTPIQTILGVVELFKDTELDSEQSEYVHQIRFSADVLLGLINDILDFSKIEAGKLDLETSTFDLRACVRDSVDLLVMDAHRKGLEIIVDIDDTLPALVRGDPGRLRQVIVNLFKNAVKFTSEGGITLTLKQVVRKSGPMMCFEVADTGPGVPAAVRDRLFTPFYQADFGLARKAGGTGLGLAISRHLAELMGGKVGLAPPAQRVGASNEGSVFWFEVPLVAPEYTAPPKAMPTGRGARILVIDDHAGARAFAARVARSAGYRVAEAESGEEALAILRGSVNEPFALCLVDQTMPQMDGWRLASEITGDTTINSARLVLMAPMGSIGGDAKMKLLRWFNGYIYKPVDPRGLLEAMERALSAEVDLEPAEREAELSGRDRDRVAAEQAVEPEPSFEVDVLIAEDHEVNRELFSIILGRLGCRVVTAEDGVEAVRIGTSRHFDIVLMDIFMPRMDGYEATRALRERGFRGPIVAVTASALKGEREKCLEAGMNDILVKPFKKKDLSDLLARILAAPAPEAGAEGPASANASAAPGRGEAPCETDPEVLDWKAAVDTFLGQSETVLRLLARFSQKASAQLEELKMSLEARDFLRFRETAHSMKGAAWNLCARRLGDAALGAEEAGRAGDAESAKNTLDLLRAEFALFAKAAARACDD
jgi:PAS domain S-box-containing protein